MYFVVGKTEYSIWPPSDVSLGSESLSAAGLICTWGKRADASHFVILII